MSDYYSKENLMTLSEETLRRFLAGHTEACRWHRQKIHAHMDAMNEVAQALKTITEVLNEKEKE